MKLSIKNVSKGLLLVPALLLGLSFIPASVSAVDCTLDDGIGGGAQCATPEDEQRSLVGGEGIFQQVVNILLFIVGAVAVIMLIIGGIRYVISNGDQSNVTAAKNTILYAIIGIVVAFLAYAIVDFVVTQLGDTTSV